MEPRQVDCGGMGLRLTAKVDWLGLPRESGQFGMVTSLSQRSATGR
jgi:hypothetical protein